METFDSVESFVRAKNGKKAIKKVLIANNGIGAVKAIRSMRRWAFETFGKERAIQFVVMATPEDLKANAEYIRMADAMVDVPGGTNKNNYANVKLIVEIAERWNVDAVWAGWGHASENPKLPESLASSFRNISFIGPDGGPMMALGDKIGSTIIAQSANVPCIDWNGTGITTNYKEDGISSEVYASATIKSAEQAYEVCMKIGLPVMIKASEGGGGKGIRKVSNLDDVSAAYRQVASEVAGSPIFIMKLAPKSRHLEVQLLADMYGQAIALDGRDCSVQRRHQKIIEEGPPIIAPKEIWKQMERAAINLAKEVGYSNAGTVEYLYVEEEKKFYFLELNPRLQVEHPVTEMITRVNLPAAQLQVAMGIPLHQISDIRKLYGCNPNDSSLIDFDNADRVDPAGHCIAVRITAENPDQGFQPTSGTIEELNFRSTPDVWGYFSVDSSGLVHEFADSQFGHLFAGGENRESARKAMIIALKELSIRGNIRTTVEYIAELMNGNDYIKNQIDTTWLDAHIAKRKSGLTIDAMKNLIDPSLAVSIGAVITTYQRLTSNQKEFSSQLSKGLIPPKELLDAAFDLSLTYHGIKYIMKCSQAGPQTFTVLCGTSFVEAQCRELADGGFLVIVGEKSHVVYAFNEASGLRLSVNGSTAIFMKEYDPTSLEAEVAGKLAKCLVPDGTHLKAGAPYAEVEVMKMYMPVTVKESGIIHWELSEGATLQPGDRLATLELDDPSSVVKAAVFTGDLTIPSSGSNDGSFDKPHMVLKFALQKLDLVLWGYSVPYEQYELALKNLKDAICDPILPFHEFEEALWELTGKIDEVLFSKLKALAISYTEKNAKKEIPANTKFPFSSVSDLLSKCEVALNDIERISFINNTENLRIFINQYKKGVHSRLVHALVELVKNYLSVERGFSGSDLDEALHSLRLTHSTKGELMHVFDMYRSHLSINKKNSLLLTILDDIELACLQASKHGESSDSTELFIPANEEESGLLKELGALIPLLTELGNFTDAIYSSVSSKARALLIQQRKPSITQRKNALKRAITDAVVEDSLEAVNFFVNENVPLRDLLLYFLSDSQNLELPSNIASKIVEIYIRQIYRTYSLKSFSSEKAGSINWCKWIFSSLQEEASPPGISSSTSFVDLTSFARTHSGLKLVQNDGSYNSDLSISTAGGIPSHVERIGAFVIVPTIMRLKEYLDNTLRVLASSLNESNRPVNVLHIAIIDIDNDLDPSNISSTLQNVLSDQTNNIHSAMIRRITFLVGTKSQDSSQPLILTYRNNANAGSFIEDPLLRDIEPSNAHLLDLGRLSNFAIRLVSTVQLTGADLHLYAGIPKETALREGISKGQKNNFDSRFFARLVSQGSELLSGGGKRYHVEKLFVEALSAIDLALTQFNQHGGSKSGVSNLVQPSKNHIFINSMTPDKDVHPSVVADHMEQLMVQYGDKIARLGVTHFEMKLICRLVPDSHPVPIRLVATNPTGFVVRVDTYVETQASGNDVIFRSIGGFKDLEWEGLSVKTPYPILRPLESQRQQAQLRSDTLYCYDFLHLFERANQLAWQEFNERRIHSSFLSTQSLMEATELVVTRKQENDLNDPAAWTLKDLDNLVIQEVNRPPGKNNVGMVAWMVRLKTPEYPDGREIVLIANDITYKAGSFGTREDVVFLLASNYARSKGIPRLYIAANSGARIGMAESVKGKFKVAWQHENEPALGYRYLYLEDDDYKHLSKLGAVRCIEAPDEKTGEKRWRITDIIGEEPDLGVENLRGSGAIAGETSKAYAETFTLTLVVGRTVGIGAYLVRLGQRTIQNVNNAPILLTGYQALNTLMGREVYSSNDQLGGGLSVMYPNGVSHILSSTHMNAVKCALKWISYIPAKRGAILPIHDIAGIDEIEREIAFQPIKGVPYDPRHLLEGHINEMDNSFVTGFFDRNSFTETLAGWAKTVGCGRARLGGIPVGVIFTENRAREKKYPADPADLTSQEKLIQQAGCVWYPDSASKTAQAIRDFNREGLPLIIFANWRGFSGGQRDMFDEILKFGALIVDALVAYKQPVFVYIPPYSELRGGAWVVVDPCINLEMMEMYAADESRGGVLEADGVASIKFRNADIVAAAHRLDPVLISLDEKLRNCKEEFKELVLAECKQRESRLMGVYKQLSVQFADLHDTPGRMEAVEAVKKVIPLAQARIFFYWRLRRRLAELDLLRQVNEVVKDSAFEPESAMINVKEWFLSDCKREDEDWDNDKIVLAWMASNANDIQSKIEKLKYLAVKSDTEALLRKSPEAAIHGVLDAIQSFDSATKQAIISKLSSSM